MFNLVNISKPEGRSKGSLMIMFVTDNIFPKVNETTKHLTSLKARSPNSIASVERIIDPDF